MKHETLLYKVMNNHREAGANKCLLYLYPLEIGSEQLSPEQLIDKIRHLQKENEYLKRQREILKKSYEYTGRGAEQLYAMIEELPRFWGAARL